jgi:hypothetical protein
MTNGMVCLFFVAMGSNSIPNIRDHESTKVIPRIRSFKPTIETWECISLLNLPLFFERTNVFALRNHHQSILRNIVVTFPSAFFHLCFLKMWYARFFCNKKLLHLKTSWEIPILAILKNRYGYASSIYNWLYSFKFIMVKELNFFFLEFIRKQSSGKVGYNIQGLGFF